MSTSEKKKNSDLFTNVWTIPNILTFIRILLVPVFAVLFLKNYYMIALVILLLSSYGLLTARLQESSIR